MPHLNGEDEENSEAGKDESEEVLAADGENKHEGKEKSDAKKTASSPSPKSEDGGAHRWPPYPPHGARHPPPPPYYGYDYPGWGHHPPPPHGDPYARSRRSYPPHPPTSPVRRESDDGAKESPAKGSPEQGKDERAYDKHGYPHHMHPPPPHYPPYGMPPPPYGYPGHHYYEEHYRAAEEARLARKKRHSEKDESEEAPSTKKVRVQESKADEKTDKEEEKSDKSADEGEEKEEAKEESSKEGEEKPSEDEEEKEKSEGKPKKTYAVDKDGKRIISPTSSFDGTNKGDDSSSPSIQQKLSASSSGSFPPGESRPSSSSYDPYYPHPEAYPYGSSRGGYPPYYPHPMYAGYPPPPAHYYRDHPPPPGYYDPPSPRSGHYHSRDYPPPPRGYHGGPHPIHGSFESAGSKAAEETEKEGRGSSSAGSSREPSPREDQSLEAGDDVPKKIKSVSDWRAAAMATGTAPSANRCMQLQEPIPSKCWGTPEHAETIIIPDFHRLVNYPDYLIKNYPDYLRKTRKERQNQSDKDGKRHCVMCGQARLCSATSAKAGPSSRVRTPKFANSMVDEEHTEHADSTTHIIPRQNKGLCTACDIQVWVIADSGVEIKWCKGCKNFRPWAAFGDKGMATKCVRCRDRQREKYASQKEKLRANRQSKKMSGGKGGQHEIAAAKGLRDLMAASMTSV